jgi:hypothetical protein
MEGWELDPAIAWAASNFMGLGHLVESGALTAHVDDALGDSAVVEGGFAAVVVDIFVGAALLPALTEEATWRKLRERCELACTRRPFSLSPPYRLRLHARCTPERMICTRRQKRVTSGTSYMQFQGLGFRTYPVINMWLKG